MDVFNAHLHRHVQIVSAPVIQL